MKTEKKIFLGSKQKMDENIEDHGVIYSNDMDKSTIALLEFRINELEVLMERMGRRIWDLENPKPARYAPPPSIIKPTPTKLGEEDWNDVDNYFNVGWRSTHSPA